MAEQPEIAIEQALLGSLVLGPEYIDEVADVLRPDDFQWLEHRQAYSVMLDMARRREPIGIITLADVLARAHGQAGKWTTIIAEWEAQVTSSAHTRHYAHRVADSAVVKQVAAVCRNAADNAPAIVPGNDRAVADYVESIESRIFQLAHRRAAAARCATPQEALPALIASMRNARIEGLQTGIYDLDEVLLGLRGGEFFVVGARPGVGKTTLAMQIALNVAAMGGMPLFVSLEMTQAEMFERCLCNLGNIDSHDMRRRRLGEAEYARIDAAANTMMGWRMMMCDDAGTTPARLRSIARRTAGQYGLDIIVVDYIQLMQEPAYHGDRVAEVSAISRSLKELAREMNVPVVALSQLNRAAEKERPGLHHLRESGSIEQDADQVGLLWADASVAGCPLRCAIEKNRHGKLDVVDLAYRPAFYQISGTQPVGLARAESFNFNADGSSREYD